ncbi:MAG: nitroreductase family deazaflavin-dependent oxidoreductase [Chloroflexota bacterium]
MNSNRLATTMTPLPYPAGFGRALLRLPVLLYRLGLGGLLGGLPLMILGTRGRKSGLPRYTPVEYRQHGSKYYIVSAWGRRPQWFQNLLASPEVSVQCGTRRFAARASVVEDSGEAARALYLFRKRAPLVYDALLALLSGTPSVNQHTLPDISDAFTIVRLDRQPADTLPVAPLEADLAWVARTGLLAIVVAFSVALFVRLRRP